MRISVFVPVLAAGLIVIAPSSAAYAQRSARTNYAAKLVAVNSSVTGRAAAGEATFRIRGDSLRISVRMRHVPANIAHLQHFHGFVDGRQSVCPTRASDKNGDGIIDLMETEPVAGTTMVPFTANPVSMEIVTDTYPKASADGSYTYHKTVSLSALQAAFSAKYPGQKLALDHRVVFIHGVPATTKLPASVASLGDIPAQVTIPIACGAIKRVK